MLFGDPLMPPHVGADVRDRRRDAEVRGAPGNARFPASPSHPEPPPGPERVRGAPLLAWCSRDPGNWTGAPGGDVAFQLAITSTWCGGSPGSISRLGGPAIDGKLDQAGRGDARRRDERVRPARAGNVWRAELPALAFEAGFARIELEVEDRSATATPNPSREARASGWPR